MELFRQWWMQVWPRHAKACGETLGGVLNFSVGVWCILGGRLWTWVIWQGTAVVGIVLITIWRARRRLRFLERWTYTALGTTVDVEADVEENTP